MEDMPKPPRPAFESWGRYPITHSRLAPLNWTTDFPAADVLPGKCLPAGMGRSYGDVCLLDQGTLLLTRGMNRLYDFNQQTGVLRCEAGVTLAEILDFAVPRGWFLPVSPGTKYVTIGGAIANDIHGKNHHVAGTFGNHVPRFELARSDGSRFICSPTENTEWYRATIGGMGLTGLITWAELQLKPIVSRKIVYGGTQFHGIDEFLALTRAAQHIEYTVAWIDCASRGRNFARGIFMQGDHSEEPAPLKTASGLRVAFPFDLPEFALNRATIGLFNTVYFHKQFGKHTESLIDYEPFFYPLDAVLHWNRMYGSRGLLQFQCVVPWSADHRGIIAILDTISKSGLASFLAVLKVFGNVPSRGMMSFPAPGITLALDFPIRPSTSFALFERLGAMVVELGGRMYPAKDARMTAYEFQTFYPQWRDFSAYIDPHFSSDFWKRVTNNG
jgi:FAD/FMN-containing dehydrogenase